MPDKECTVNLIELSFAMGQLRADSNRPKGIVSNIIAMLGAWECRKSGDDGKAYEGLVTAADNAFKGRPENVTKANFDKMWAEYHSLMKAMGYLDLDIVDEPRRAPIPDIGIEAGVFKDSKLRLSDAGFTDYRTVKTTRETEPQTEGEGGSGGRRTRPAEPGSMEAQLRAFTSFCMSGIARGGAGLKMGECRLAWAQFSEEEQLAWTREVGLPSPSQEEPPAADKPKRTRTRRTQAAEGASRWTPPISRNAILR